MLSASRHIVSFVFSGLLMSLCVASPLVGQSEEETSKGERLARGHCATCHLFPEPELLPQESWRFLLTYMGFFMGVVDYSELEGASESTMDSIQAREEFLRIAKLVPESPTIGDADWNALKAYYLEESPLEALPQATKSKVIEDAESFVVRSSQYEKEAAITSMVFVDETHELVLVHDSREEQLTVLDNKLRLYDAHPSPGVALVDAESKGDELYLLSIGDLFAANIGEGFGEIQQVEVLGRMFISLDIVLKGLHRPSDFKLADLDNDGVDEALVSNFGDYTGNFSIYRRKGSKGAFDPEPQLLSEESGIVRSETHDFNGDGLLDIVVLMSAGRENVSLFLSNGKGGFERRVLVEKHPSFGYTGLELRDFDGDGRVDILTVNGDNGDSDPYNTLKRDHGIRIYLNQGELDFEESYFYPMYGAFGAKVEDFDLDGDLDIAAIAYHPDFYSEKPENFVLLEQTGRLEFSAKTHPATYNGRWLTIGAGDFDGDGDKDILLGAAYLPVGMKRDHEAKFLELVESGPALLVLENRADRSK